MDDDNSVDLYGDLDGFGTSPIKANKLLISPPSVSNGLPRSPNKTRASKQQSGACGFGNTFAVPLHSGNAGHRRLPSVEDQTKASGDVSKPNTTRSSTHKHAFQTLMNSIIQGAAEEKYEEEDDTGEATTKDESIGMEEAAEDSGHAMPAVDLMDDVYSLHTEKDIEHRTQLQHKQREIDTLNKEKYDLVLQNKQLQHNMALLLATAKKELDAQKGIVLTLRKQLLDAEKSSTRSYCHTASITPREISRDRYRPTTCPPQAEIPTRAAVTKGSIPPEGQSEDRRSYQTGVSKLTDNHRRSNSKSRSPSRHHSRDTRHDNKRYQSSDSIRSHSTRLRRTPERARSPRRPNRQSCARDIIKSRVDKAKERLRQQSVVREQSVTRTGLIDSGRLGYGRSPIKHKPRSPQETTAQESGSIQSSLKSPRKSKLKSPRKSKRSPRKAVSPGKAKSKHKTDSKTSDRGPADLEDESITDLYELQQKLLLQLGEGPDESDIATNLEATTSAEQGVCVDKPGTQNQTISSSALGNSITSKPSSTQCDKIVNKPLTVQYEKVTMLACQISQPSSGDLPSAKSLSVINGDIVDKTQDPLEGSSPLPHNMESISDVIERCQKKCSLSSVHDISAADCNDVKDPTLTEPSAKVASNDICRTTIDLNNIDTKQVMETAKCALQNLHQIIQDECEAPELAPVEEACKSEADRNALKVADTDPSDNGIVNDEPQLDNKPAEIPTQSIPPTTENVQTTLLSDCQNDNKKDLIDKPKVSAAKCTADDKITETKPQPTSKEESKKVSKVKAKKKKSTPPVIPLDEAAGADENIDPRRTELYHPCSDELELTVVQWTVEGSKSTLLGDTENVSAAMKPSGNHHDSEAKDLPNDINIEETTPKVDEGNATRLEADDSESNTKPAPTESVIAPAESEPKAAESEPKAAESEPKAAESEPKAAESEPKAAESEPKAAESEPKAAESEPKAAESEPKAAESEPKALDVEIDKSAVGAPVPGVHNEPSDLLNDLRRDLPSPSEQPDDLCDFGGQKFTTSSPIKLAEPPTESKKSSMLDLCEIKAESNVDDESRTGTHVTTASQEDLTVKREADSKPLQPLTIETKLHQTTPLMSPQFTPCSEISTVSPASTAESQQLEVLERLQDLSKEITSVLDVCSKPVAKKFRIPKKRQPSASSDAGSVSSEPMKSPPTSRSHPMKSPPASRSEPMKSPPASRCENPHSTKVKPRNSNASNKSEQDTERSDNKPARRLERSNSRDSSGDGSRQRKHDKSNPLRSPSSSAERKPSNRNDSDTVEKVKVSTDIDAKHWHDNARKSSTVKSQKSPDLSRSSHDRLKRRDRGERSTDRVSVTEKPSTTDEKPRGGIKVAPEAEIGSVKVKSEKVTPEKVDRAIHPQTTVNSSAAGEVSLDVNEVFTPESSCPVKPEPQTTPDRPAVKTLPSPSATSHTADRSATEKSPDKPKKAALSLADYKKLPRAKRPMSDESMDEDASKRRKQSESSGHLSDTGSVTRGSGSVGLDSSISLEGVVSSSPEKKVDTAAEVPVLTDITEELARITEAKNPKVKKEAKPKNIPVPNTETVDTSPVKITTTDTSKNNDVKKSSHTTGCRHNKRETCKRCLSMHLSKDSDLKTFVSITTDKSPNENTALDKESCRHGKGRSCRLCRSGSPQMKPYIKSSNPKNKVSKVATMETVVTDQAVEDVKESLSSNKNDEPEECRHDKSKKCRRCRSTPALNRSRSTSRNQSLNSSSSSTRSKPSSDKIEECRHDKDKKCRRCRSRSPELDYSMTSGRSNSFDRSGSAKSDSQSASNHQSPLKKRDLARNEVAVPKLTLEKGSSPSSFMRNGKTIDCRHASDRYCRNCKSESPPEGNRSQGYKSSPDAKLSSDNSPVKVEKITPCKHPKNESCRKCDQSSAKSDKPQIPSQETTEKSCRHAPEKFCNKCKPTTQGEARISSTADKMVCSVEKKPEEEVEKCRHEKNRSCRRCRSRSPGKRFVHGKGDNEKTDTAARMEPNSKQRSRSADKLNHKRSSSPRQQLDKLHHRAVKDDKRKSRSPQRRSKFGREDNSLVITTVLRSNSRGKSRPDSKGLCESERGGRSNRRRSDSRDRSNRDRVRSKYSRERSRHSSPDSARRSQSSSSSQPDLRDKLRNRSNKSGEASRASREDKHAARSRSRSSRDRRSRDRGSSRSQHRSNSRSQSRPTTEKKEAGDRRTRQDSSRDAILGSSPQPSRSDSQTSADFNTRSEASTRDSSPANSHLAYESHDDLNLDTPTEDTLNDCDAHSNDDTLHDLSEPQVTPDVGDDDQHKPDDCDTPSDTQIATTQNDAVLDISLEDGELILSEGEEEFREEIAAENPSKRKRAASGSAHERVGTRRGSVNDRNADSRPRRERSPPRHDKQTRQSDKVSREEIKSDTSRHNGRLSKRSASPNDRARKRSPIQRVKAKSPSRNSEYDEKSTKRRASPSSQQRREHSPIRPGPNKSRHAGIRSERSRSVSKENIDSNRSTRNDESHSRKQRSRSPGKTRKDSSRHNTASSNNGSQSDNRRSRKDEGIRSRRAVSPRRKNPDKDVPMKRRRSVSAERPDSKRTRTQPEKSNDGLRKERREDRFKSTVDDAGETSDSKPGRKEDRFKSKPASLDKPSSRPNESGDSKRISRSRSKERQLHRDKKPNSSREEVHRSTRRIRK